MAGRCSGLVCRVQIDKEILGVGLSAANHRGYGWNNGRTGKLAKSMAGSKKLRGTSAASDSMDCLGIMDGLEGRNLVW